MAPSDPQAKLFPDEKLYGDTVVINGRCVLRADGDQRLVLVGGLPVAHFEASDRAAEANAMVLLVDHGYAQQTEVACAFGCDVRSVRRFQRRYEEGGLVALLRVAGYPKGQPRERGRDRRVGALKESGHSNREIARRLGIDEKAVRKRLRRLGWKPPPQPAQLAFPTAKGADPNLSGRPPPPVGEPAAGVAEGADPNLSGYPAPPVGEPAEEIPFTSDTDPANRKMDRLFAFIGLLDDAAPLFRDGTAVPGAGVLLAVPDLVATGVLGAARQVWGSIGPAFYGLRTTVMTMLLMALLRVQRPEALKERSPLDFGRVLGLDRAPEVKTVRRKLTRFAALGGVETFGGHKVSYELADQGVRIGKLRLRQVTRRQEGHQTPVLTSRRDLPAIEIAHRMFARWRQENFFKYLRDEYLIDALIDHKIEPDDPMREIPNPKWAAADDKLREARAEITKLQRAAFVGDTLDALDGTAPRGREVMANLKSSHRAVWAAMQRSLTLSKRRDRIPRRLPIGETTDEPIIKLATQRKHLSNLLKMVAYQAESALTNTVAPHYSRADEEGRTLVQTALASAADITVTRTELVVTLAPLSSPHRSRAIAALCDKLSATRTVFPGTRLRLRYAVAGVAAVAAPAP